MKHIDAEPVMDALKRRIDEASWDNDRKAEAFQEALQMLIDAPEYSSEKQCCEYVHFKRFPPMRPPNPEYCNCENGHAPCEAGRKPCADFDSQTPEVYN